MPADLIEDWANQRKQLAADGKPTTWDAFLAMCKLQYEADAAVQANKAATDFANLKWQGSVDGTLTLMNQLVNVMAPRPEPGDQTRTLLQIWGILLCIGMLTSKKSIPVR